MVDIGGYQQSESSGGGGETEAYSRQQYSSSTTPNAQLAPQATALLNEAKPLGTEWVAQLLEALKTGGVNAQIPIVSKAVESSRQASSQALAGIDKYLAQMGLAGTPFGANTRATQMRTGEQQAAQIGTDYIMQLLSQIPAYLSSTREAGIAGLKEAGTTVSQGTSSSESYGKNKPTESESSGGSCCFIFLAASDGITLHPIVRQYRDAHLTPRNRRGYYFLSDRLVPFIQRYRLARRAVRFLLTRPLTLYGLYRYRYSPLGFLAAPLAAFWLLTFSLLGCRPPYTRRGTKEVV